MDNPSHTIFIFAGEKSGDLHGGELITALKRQNPNLHLYGVGGPKMRSEGFECFLPMENFQVMGFVDVFFALPKLLFYFYKIARHLLKNPPDLIVFIDYPGFNLRLAKHLKKKKIPSKLCHFICPSVWAHGKKRIKTMEQTLDHLLTILPFEKQYFENTTLPVTYVGHPLVSRIAESKHNPLPISPGKKLIALFPGSRLHEIKRNLPLQIAACKALKALDPTLLFAISVAGDHVKKEIHHQLSCAGFTFDLLVPEKDTYPLMQTAYSAIATSGTVNLELALHNVPTVVMYAVSRIDLFIVKYILKLNLPFYGIVNIIAEKEVFPELFGPKLTEQSLIQKVTSLVTDPATHKRCQEECLVVKNLLGTGKASDQAAKILTNLRN